MKKIAIIIRKENGEKGPMILGLINFNQLYSSFLLDDTMAIIKQFIGQDLNKLSKEINEYLETLGEIEELKEIEVGDVTKNFLKLLRDK